MRPRFPSFTERRKCAEDLRAHTAELLHRPTVGHAPHVGAAIGAGKSRVQNMVTAECANPLELLKRWHDELESRGVDPELLDDWAREIAGWRHRGLTPLLGEVSVADVQGEASNSAREIGEALYTALARAKTAAEKTREVHQAIEALRRLALACEREGLAVVKSKTA